MERGKHPHGKEMAISASPLEFVTPLLGDGLAPSHPAPLAGRSQQTAAPAGLTYDPECYLCPGNQRAGGEKNPEYSSVFSFVNDYAAVLPNPPAIVDEAPSPLLAAEPVQGICKVLCFHPDHSLTLAKMQPADIRRVIDAWAAETQEIAALDWIRYIQIFENRGAMMGASNPHP